MLRNLNIALFLEADSTIVQKGRNKWHKEGRGLCNRLLKLQSVKKVKIIIGQDELHLKMSENEMFLPCRQDKIQPKRYQEQ